jgi:hypothetical protein
MNTITRSRPGSLRGAALTAAALAAVALGAAGCGGSGAAPPVGAPPASAHTAAERAATLRWLASTNLMWTKDDFSGLDQVTTGAARAVYLAERRQASAGTSPAHRRPLRLTGLSITVPCHRGPAAAFVAYADTDVFTLGQSVQPEALVFLRVGGTWKLAVVVHGPAGGQQPRWPALCRDGVDPGGPAVLAPANFPATLARVLDAVSGGPAATARTAAPFAVNSFLAGPDSVGAQFAAERSHDRAGQVNLAQHFTPAGGPALALPLAGGRGYWLIGVLTQTATHHSAAGIRKATWPDGVSIAAPRPAVVHDGTDAFVTTYAAIDPLRSAGGRLLLDGFFGWPLASTAR